MSGTRIREIRVRGFRPANDRRFRWPVDDNSRQARGQVLTRELLDKHRKRWLNELAYFSKIGGVDFLGVGWLGGTAETLRRRYYYFPEVFEILQSSDDENRKLDRLASLDRERSLDWSDLRLRDRCQLMIRTFQSSPQLEERLKVFKSRRMEEAVRQPVQ